MLSRVAPAVAEEWGKCSPAGTSRDTGNISVRESRTAPAGGAVKGVSLPIHTYIYIFPFFFFPFLFDKGRYGGERAR